MLDLGFSGTALGVASAASGFVADPLAGADGVAGFCPPCAVAPPVPGLEGDAFGGVFWPEVAGATLGLVAEVPGAVAAGGVVAAGPLEPVSAFAGKANAMAKNGMATRPRNCGKKVEKRICSTLVAQNPIARRPLR
jgi:hypothetical protein